MKRWWVAVACLGVAGCIGPPLVTNSGYTGTWSRGRDRSPSILAIVKVGDVYRVRWSKRTEDGRLQIKCNWDGACEEFFEGAKVADYQFGSWLDAESGHLFVEVVEKRTVPTVFEQRYTDELVLDPGGKILHSHTVERNGERFPLGEGSSRSFDKVSDGVIDPPRLGT
jgi:hypothetical protein